MRSGPIIMATLYALMLLCLPCHSADGCSQFYWENLTDLPHAADQAFFGLHNRVLILAGGVTAAAPDRANLSDRIWIKTLPSDANTTTQWRQAGSLNRPAAFGASVSTPHGLLCIGGADFEECLSDVFLLSYSPDSDTVQILTLPSLPAPAAFVAAACLDDVLYVAGGQTTPDRRTATNNCWSLDLPGILTRSATSTPSPTLVAWNSLPPLPASRTGSTLAPQHNGRHYSIYLLGDLRTEYTARSAPARQAFRFDPARGRMPPQWTRIADSPVPITSGFSMPLGQSHIFVLTAPSRDSVESAAFMYHTITDTWVRNDQPPLTAAFAAAVDNTVIVAGRASSDDPNTSVWRAAPLPAARTLGATTAAAAANYAAVVAYLLIIVIIGVSFSRRNRNTDDFFRGGRRIPWWVAGLSIFATMLSSITYIAIPAKAYAADWVYFVGHVMILAVTPFIVFLILPFFRRIDATSAYEYLEKRFNLFLRLFAAASFVLFQIGRMAIVMFLPAIALAAITPLHVSHCILAMGLLSILYCTFGGFEAVVWTDALQTVVLLTAAFLSLGMIVNALEGGLGELVSTASAAGKFHMIDLDFSSASFTTTALWVVVIGTVGQNLVSYTSDQAVIQRYVATADARKAAKALWLNGILSVPAGILFFSLGTALFVFYKTHPQHLDCTLQTDAVFPLFIARQLPPGLAGLVIAGILAAAQSTLSTGMNSTATVLVTDFARRFDMFASDRACLNLARFLTVLIGAAATALALMFASGDVRSLWDQFLTVLGLFGGSMAGVFLLGIFTTRTTPAGAAFGAVAGAAALFAVKTLTDVHLLLYAAVGIAACMISGRLASEVFPKQYASLDGLTIYTLDKTTRPE